MSPSLVVLTDRLDSPFIDLEYMVRFFVYHSLNVKYYVQERKLMRSLFRV